MSARGAVTSGFLALFSLVAGFGVWAAVSQISGAVVAPGVIEVEQNRRVVQHLRGGVVVDILVRDGDVVAAGDVLMRLDDTVLADLSAAAQAVQDDLAAQAAVFQAQIAAAQDVDFPPDLLVRSRGDAPLAALLETHREMRRTHRAIEVQREKELQGHTRQLQERIAGIEAALAAQQLQLDLIDEQLRDQKTLQKQGLVPARVVLGLKRERARLIGALGQLSSDKAAAFSAMSHARLQASGRQLAGRQRDMATLAEINRQLLQKAQEVRALKEQFAQTVVTAPVSGVVLGIAVNTPRAVIKPGQVILSLVPQDRPMVIAARVAPRQIGGIVVGQSADVHLPGQNGGEPVVLKGHVAQVSADVIRSEGSSQPYYRVEVELPSSVALAHETGDAILPGMPVDVFLHTQSRTALAYLLEPVTAYLSRAFRES